MRIVLISICAFLLDLLLGDPAWLTPIHPVVLMGHGIRWLEKTLREVFPKTPCGERLAGAVMALLLPTGTILLSGWILLMLGKLFAPLAWTMEAIWCWQALAARNLREEAMNVYRCITEGTLPDAQRAVGRIVGRDTAVLDRTGVIRAAVETVAENFSDGVIAPMLYMLLGGAPLALGYKAINTMDSMVGYKNTRYFHFGMPAAKLDDAANLLPSRLAALLLIAATGVCGEHMKDAMRIWRRDRRKHASPNAAQCEAAMAGALGIQLCGPAYYFGERIEKPYIGDNLRPTEAGDIRRACRLEMTGSLLGLILMSAIRLGWLLLTGG